MNSDFFINAHSVPVIELLTLNVVVIILIVCILQRYLKWNTQTSMIILVILLIASVLLYQHMGIPNNLGRFVGLGDKPVGWRGV
jgi:prepilin signal peptidase PulO-like enzyme (type II secretory pathway)